MINQLQNWLTRKCINCCSVSQTQSKYQPFYHDLRGVLRELFLRPAGGWARAAATATATDTFGVAFVLLRAPDRAGDEAGDLLLGRFLPRDDSRRGGVAPLGGDDGGDDGGGDGVGDGNEDGGGGGGRVFESLYCFVCLANLAASVFVSAACRASCLLRLKRDALR